MRLENEPIISYEEVAKKWESYLGSLSPNDLVRLKKNNHNLYERYLNYIKTISGRPDTDHAYEAIAGTHSVPEDPVILGREIEKALSSQRN